MGGSQSYTTQLAELKARVEILETKISKLEETLFSSPSIEEKSTEDEPLYSILISHSDNDVIHETNVTIDQINEMLSEISSVEIPAFLDKGRIWAIIRKMSNTLHLLTDNI